MEFEYRRPSPEIWQQPYPDEVVPSRATTVSWKCLEEAVEGHNDQIQNALRRDHAIYDTVKYNTNWCKDRCALTIKLADHMRLPQFERPEWTPEITLRWLIYQLGVLMIKYLQTIKIPSELSPTSISNRIAVLNRFTGTIIASSIDGNWGRSYEQSRLEMLQRQRGYLDDYYATMRQGIPIAQEEFIIMERRSACKRLLSNYKS